MKLTTTQHGNEVTTEYNKEDLATVATELAAVIRQLAATQTPPGAGAQLTGAVRQRRQGQCYVVPQFNQQSSTAAVVEEDESSPVTAVKGATKRSGKKSCCGGRSSHLKQQPKLQDEAPGKVAGVCPLLPPTTNTGMARQAQAAVCLEGGKLV